MPPRAEDALDPVGRELGADARHLTDRGGAATLRVTASHVDDRSPLPPSGAFGIRAVLGLRRIAVA
jgi:hypothetical protein